MNVDWRTLPNAPAAGTRLCQLEDLVSGEIRRFSFASDQSSGPAFELIVHRRQEHVKAYVNQCPHHWLPMNRRDGTFLMWSEDEVMCTHHSAVFNLVLGGECILGPCLGSNLIKVPVAIVNGTVLISDER